MGWNPPLVFACEGGHTDFAPQGELQIELLRFLTARFGHVSYERILSGPGLVNVYEFLRDKDHGEEPSWLADAVARDPAAAISRAALGKSPLADRLSICGSRSMAQRQGISRWKQWRLAAFFWAGGISPKLFPTDGPAFMQAFLDKGRMHPLLESMPVKVITNDKPGLLGAARCAVAQAQASEGRADDDRAERSSNRR